jgi:hypothetical protein
MLREWTVRHVCRLVMLKTQYCQCFFSPARNSGSHYSKCAGLTVCVGATRDLGHESLTLFLLY